MCVCVCVCVRVCVDGQMGLFSCGLCVVCMSDRGREEERRVCE